MGIEIILTFLAFAAVSAPDSGLAAGEHRRSIEVNGRERSYIVHVPRVEGSRSPFPVVLAFHGGGSNARQMIRFCGLNKKADEAGFIVVYPEGTGRRPERLTWNVGNCCGVAFRQRIDDVEFVRQLIDDLERVTEIDSNRIYATGMSNGAMMSYRLASELSDRIAAIAPVAGPMGTRSCNPQRPVSVMHFHGTDDAFAPFEGGQGARSLTRTQFYSVEYSIDAWAKANGCSDQPTISTMPNPADDGMTTRRKHYAKGRNNTEVILFLIEGGGHTWPGKVPRLRFLGPSTSDISANDLMWEFFQRHSLRPHPDPPDAP